VFGINCVAANLIQCVFLLLYIQHIDVWSS